MRAETRWRRAGDCGGEVNKLAGTEPWEQADSEWQKSRRVGFGPRCYHRSVRSAPVAQLDRAIGFEPIGRGFESLRARHSYSFRLNGEAYRSWICEHPVG